MADWAQIDRELEQLGPAPRDVAALLTRCLGSDRSRAALEAALGALGVAPPVTAPALPGGAGSTPRPIAPRPRESSDRPLSSHDTMEEWPPEPPPAAQQLADDVDALLGVAEPAAIVAEAEPLAAAADEDEPELSLGGASDAPPAASDTPPAPEAHTLESTRALLDRELDPSEFPSTPPQRVPTPAPPAAEPAALEDDDFELLIEDEEILEIQEDDVEADDVDET